MGRTNAERVRAWMERKSQAGGKNLSVWLDAQSVAILEAQRRPGENNNDLINRVIQANVDRSESISTNVSISEEAVSTNVNTNETDVSINVSTNVSTNEKLVEIRDQINHGRRSADLRTEIEEAVRIMRAQGMTFEAIAVMLNQAGIPTFRPGRGGQPGEWYKGTVANLEKKAR